MLNHLKACYGPKICSTIPLSIWHRLLDIELVIPHWHVVSDQSLDHISGIYKYRNQRQFKEDLEFFLRYYTPISLADIIKHLDGFRRLPKRCFLPTFDDGFREIYDIIAPILQTHGIPAAFFLITSLIDNHVLGYPQKKSLLIRAIIARGSSSIEFEVSKRLTNAGIKGKDIISRIGNIYYVHRHILDELAPIVGCDFAAYVTMVKPYLTSTQVSDLIKNGFAIGAHSIDHPLYSELSIDEQVIQTKNSLKILSERFEYNCNAFAFPYNDKSISPLFFQKAFIDSELKVTFGIGGIQNHYFRRNLPRFSMERTDMPAKKILARQFGRALLHIS